MNVLEAIRTKRAVRQFTDEPIPRDVLAKILRAGLRAQSSKNTQPWHLVVVEDRQMLLQLSKLGDFLGYLAGASACVMLAASDDSPWTYFDLGQCASYLQLSALELGVGSCLGAIYQPSEAKKLLGVPADMSLQALVSLGYPSADHQVARLGGRKPISEAVHWERW